MADPNTIVEGAAAYLREKGYSRFGWTLDQRYVSIVWPEGVLTGRRFRKASMVTVGRLLAIAKAEGWDAPEEAVVEVKRDDFDDVQADVAQAAAYLIGLGHEVKRTSPCAIFPFNYRPAGRVGWRSLYGAGLIKAAKRAGFDPKEDVEG